MIKWNNGNIDNRRVLSTYHRLLKKFANVCNNDGTFEEICIDDSHSSSPTDPIYGGQLGEATIDATPEDHYNWRKLHGIVGEGDYVEIYRGRKMKGERKTIVRFEKTSYKLNNYYKAIIEDEYAIFTDGTRVKREYCRIVEVNS